MSHINRFFNLHHILELINAATDAMADARADFEADAQENDLEQAQENAQENTSEQVSENAPEIPQIIVQTSLHEDEDEIHSDTLGNTISIRYIFPLAERKIKSHQIHDFCDHNDKLTQYYSNKLYCDECVPKDVKSIKIYNNERVCAVCLDDDAILDIIYDCGHMFCQNCVDNLEKDSSKCPICRS
jgi:hypothetical protein